MAIPKSLLNYLQKSKINFEPVVHKTVFTAFDLARTLRVDFKEVAKTLVVKGDNNYFIVVLSAAQMLDFGGLKKLLNVKKIEIAREKVMETVFKIPMGTITPFAGFYKTAQLCLEKGILKMKKIVVGGGSYNDAIKIKPADLVKIESPIIGTFGVKAKIKLPKPAKPAKKKPAKASKKGGKKVKKVKKSKK
jgi:prolyl-tRNA editing enzyme YbaK/EbsC (Cys-tRNA(Pro) deacylase)